MRIIQVTGFFLALIAVVILYVFVTPPSQALNVPMQVMAESGWIYTYVVTPIVCISALCLVPTTIVLFNSRLRRKYNITGKTWKALWSVNILISLAYLILFGIAYLIAQ